MSETLTTLEMLSQLKIGQMAKSLKVWIDGLEHVKRTEKGICWCDEQGNDMYTLVQLSSSILEDYRWRILPQFVAFHEAMKALKEGKTIKSYIDGRVYEVHFLEEDREFDNLCLDAVEILEGKWVIEE